MENMVQDAREMSVTQLRNTNTWMKIGENFTPGDGGINTTYDKIPRDKLIRPRLGVSKIKQCIEANRNPVDESMLASLTGTVKTLHHNLSSSSSQVSSGYSRYHELLT